MTSPASHPHACRWCGLIQLVPDELPESSMQVRCARCHALMSRRSSPRMIDRAAAFALGALVMYPPAMLLPVLELRKLGRERSSTIWSGVVEMLARGQVAVGVLVLVCSIVVPVLKITGMLMLCWSVKRARAGEAPPLAIWGVNAHHHLWTYRVIEWIGRWGMIDVLLVAILVAAVKLGDWMDVHPGPGVAAFASVVVLSLLSSACFDPHALWEKE